MSIRMLLSLSILAGSQVAYTAPVKTPQSSVPTAGDEPKQQITAKNSPSSPQGSILTSLGSISSDVEGDMTIVTIKLNKKPEWTDLTLEEHGTFLQIKLPKTQIPSSGEFIDGNGPYLKKIATFQLQDEDGALRFFLNMDASKAKMATNAELLGERIIVTIDHKKIEQLIAPQSGKGEAATAADIVAKTVVDNSVPNPAEHMNVAKNESDKLSSADSANSELYSRLAKAAAFCAVLFAGLIGIQVLRGRRQNNASPFRGKNETALPSMKVLSSISIGQKQKLTLVQIGNQQILLGVGPESVNLITTINPKQNVESEFSMALASANPQATVRLKSTEDLLPAKPQRKPANAQTLAAKSEATQVRSNRINVSVGDEGIRENVPAGRTDDITKLLRDRLKNLPPR